MVNLARKLFIIFFLLAFLFVGGSFYPQPVEAQIGVCDFIGPVCEAAGIADEEGNIVSNPEDRAVEFITNRAELVLSLVFVGITLLAVFIIIQSGVKYIQSQGEPDKIEEAQKSIKSVFVGLAILFVGVVGVFILIFALGGDEGIINPREDVESCYDVCRANGRSQIACYTECADGELDD